MRCQEVQKRLTAYLDAELEKNLKNSLEHHLLGCPQCQAQLEEMKKVLSLYESVPELKPQPEEIERIMELASSQRAKKGVRLMEKWREWFIPQKRVVRWVPVTAGVLIVFLLLLTFFSDHFVSKKNFLPEKSATIYTYYEYVAKTKPGEAEPKFGRHSFVSIY